MSIPRCVNYTPCEPRYCYPVSAPKVFTTKYNY